MTNKIEDARALAIKSFYGNSPQEIVDLLRAKIIDDKKCSCGNRLESVFDRSMLRYYYQRNICSECHNRRELERLELEEKQKAKQVEEEREAWNEFLLNKDRHVMEIAKQCGVPPKLQKANIDKPAIGNYFITGNIGTGKSYLAAGLLKNYVSSIYPEYIGGIYTIRINPKPIFVNVPELLLNIRECFNPAKKSKRWNEDGFDEDLSRLTEKGLINHYTDTPLLVLDDLGIEKVSEWSLQTLYIILNRRYEESDDKFTIITSNLSLDAISKKLDDRIGSRINGMCKILSLKGKDRRLT